MTLRPSGSHRGHEPFPWCAERVRRACAETLRASTRRVTAVALVANLPAHSLATYPGSVPGRRSVVDYSLQRRAVLAGVHAGRTGLFEVCDASPYLSRAAKYHGEATDAPCPVCRRESLTRVNYVYGDHLGPVSGQAKNPVELARMDTAQEEFTVYAVEVCRGCGWNHLECSYVLGVEPVPGRRPRRGRRRTAADQHP